MFLAILIQQQYNLTDPPLPSEYVADGLRPRSMSYHSRRGSQPPRGPQIPNPDTPDNQIVSNDFGIGPVVPIMQNNIEVSSSRQLVVPGSSSLSKRVAWPPKFRCTPENG